MSNINPILELVGGSNDLPARHDSDDISETNPTKIIPTMIRSGPEADISTGYEPKQRGSLEQPANSPHSSLLPSSSSFLPPMDQQATTKRSRMTANFGKGGGDQDLRSLNRGGSADPLYLSTRKSAGGSCDPVKEVKVKELKLKPISTEESDKFHDWQIRLQTAITGATKADVALRYIELWNKCDSTDSREYKALRSSADMREVDAKVFSAVAEAVTGRRSGILLHLSLIHI